MHMQTHHKQHRNMRMNCIAVLLAACAPPCVMAGAAPSGLPSAPQVGVVRCADRSLRLVYGLPLNLIYGPALASGADRAAFANDGGLVADARGLTLLSINGSSLGWLPANAMGAVPGVGPSPRSGAGTASSFSGRAAAWLPETSSIAVWNGSRFNVVHVDSVSGAVESITPLSAATAALYITQPGGGVVRDVVSLETGQILSSTVANPAATTMYERNGFTLSIGSHGLTISNASNQVQVLPLPAKNLVIDSVADNAIVLRSERGISSWLLQLNNPSLARGALVLSELPGPPPIEPARLFRQDGAAMSSRGVQ